MNILKDSGNRREFETGAVRDMAEGKGRFDLLPWYGIREVALQCEYGAVKYGERNVDKGIPQKFLIDSGFRHLAKYASGETDEDHLRAAAWNILWALQQRTTHPELIMEPFPIIDSRPVRGIGCDVPDVLTRILYEDIFKNSDVPDEIREKVEEFLHVIETYGASHVNLTLDANGDLTLSFTVNPSVMEATNNDG